MNTTTLPDLAVHTVHHPDPTPSPLVVQQAGHAVAAARNSAHPDNLLAIAIEKGASIEQLERLLNLKAQHDAMEARKAYVAAMAEFKLNAPTILKDRDVGYESKKKPDAGPTCYSHATLGNVVRSVITALAQHGFSHGWSTEQADGRVAVTCTLTHAAGHSERVRLAAGMDNSGSKNPIQALGSTITYLERYTLLAITGLATEDQQDDDGAGAGMGPVEGDTTSPQARLRARITNTVKMAKTLAELDKAQKDGRKALNETRDREFFDTFVKEVQAKGAQLRGNQPQGARRV